MNKDMTLSHLIVDFLPNFKNKYEVWCGINKIGITGEINELFIIEYFSDALLSFAEAQRDICAEAFWKRDSEENTYPDVGIYNAILDAPVPTTS